MFSFGPGWIFKYFVICWNLLKWGWKITQYLTKNRHPKFFLNHLLCCYLFVGYANGTSMKGTASLASNNFLLNPVLFHRICMLSFFSLFVVDLVFGNWGRHCDYWESPDGAIVHCLSGSVALDIKGIFSCNTRHQLWSCSYQHHY